MADDHIRYDLLVRDALRGVVRHVLTDVAKNGLPGEHHFFISFHTGAPGVRISSRLRAQHPEEMTIVLQHQFWDLAITEVGVEVGLSFGGVPEKLFVPFEAMKGFFDPSVQFGLEFETEARPGQGDSAETSTADEAGDPASKRDEGRQAGRETAPLSVVQDDRKPGGDDTPPSPPAGGAGGGAGGAEVVRLDRFRKK